MSNSELHQIPSDTPDNIQPEAEFGPDIIASPSMEIIFYRTPPNFISITPDP